MKKIAFTILKNDSTDGDGGFGVGVIDLNNITPIIIDCDKDEAYIDIDALHGRSQIEKKVRFSPDKAHATEDYYAYWIVWMAMEVNDKGPYYHAITASEVRVAESEHRIKLGYKSLPEQVNFLDHAMKGKTIIAHMDARSKELLRAFLQQTNADYYANTPHDVLHSLGGA